MLANNWLIDWCIFILLSRESDGALCFGRIRTRLGVDHFPSFPVDVFDFFPRKFAACSKPPSRDNYRKASYSRTQQRDQGADWTLDPAIRVVVKMTPLLIRPRCRLICNCNISASAVPYHLWLRSKWKTMKHLCAYRNAANVQSQSN